MPLAASAAYPPNHLLALPDDCIPLVAAFLGNASLGRLALTCKKLRNLLLRDPAWDDRAPVYGSGNASFRRGVVIDQQPFYFNPPPVPHLAAAVGTYCTIRART